MIHTLFLAALAMAAEPDADPVARLVTARERLGEIQVALGEAEAALSLVRRKTDLLPEVIYAATGEPGRLFHVETTDDANRQHTDDATRLHVAPFYLPAAPLEIAIKPEIPSGQHRVEVVWPDRLGAPHYLNIAADPSHGTARIDHAGRLGPAIQGPLQFRFFHRVAILLVPDGFAMRLIVVNGPEAYEIRLGTLYSRWEPLDPARYPNRPPTRRILPLTDDSVVELRPGQAAASQVREGLGVEDRFFLAHADEWLGDVEGIRPGSSYLREVFATARAFQRIDDATDLGRDDDRREATRRMRKMVGQIGARAQALRLDALQHKAKEVSALWELRTAAQAPLVDPAALVSELDAARPRRLAQEVHP